MLSRRSPGSMVPFLGQVMRSGQVNFKKWMLSLSMFVIMIRFINSQMLIGEDGIVPKMKRLQKSVRVVPEILYIFLKFFFHFWYYSVFTNEHLAIYKPNQVTSS